VPEDENPPDHPRRRQPPTERRVLQVEANAWRGPIPPPEDLERINEIIPGAAERILRQAELEQAHRHKLETRAQTFPLIDSLAGRLSALIFALACLVLAGFSVVHGQPLPAAVFGGAMIIAGINAFRKRSS
jgi:uncharacterized membrane protein